MSGCAWQELQQMYLESVAETAVSVAKGWITGVDGIGGMELDSTQILVTLMRLYAEPRGPSDSQEVVVRCKSCAVRLIVDEYGSVNIEGNCTRRRGVVPSLPVLAKMSFP